MRVLATDPGERTGWAIGIITPGDQPTLEVVEQGVYSVREMALGLENLVADVDTVIYETWRLYPHMAKKMIGNDMQPSQVIGMIRYVAWQHPKIKVISQGAGIKKTAVKIMPPDMKERMDESSEQHDQDALMHLYYHYWKDHYEQE